MLIGLIKSDDILMWVNLYIIIQVTQ